MDTEVWFRSDDTFVRVDFYREPIHLEGQYGDNVIPAAGAAKELLVGRIVALDGSRSGSVQGRDAADRANAGDTISRAYRSGDVLGLGLPPGASLATPLSWNSGVLTMPDRARGRYVAATRGHPVAH